MPFLGDQPNGECPCPVRLEPAATGRVYAAYGGVYVSVATLWLWLVDAVRPTAWDLVGVAFCLLGMVIIILGSSRT